MVQPLTYSHPVLSIKDSLVPLTPFQVSLVPWKPFKSYPCVGEMIHIHRQNETCKHYESRRLRCRQSENKSCANTYFQSSSTSLIHPDRHWRQSHDKVDWAFCLFLHTVNNQPSVANCFLTYRKTKEVQLWLHLVHTENPCIQCGVRNHTYFLKHFQHMLLPSFSHSMADMDWLFMWKTVVWAKLNTLFIQCLWIG